MIIPRNGIYNIMFPDNTSQLKKLLFISLNSKLNEVMEANRIQSE